MENQALPKLKNYVQIGAGAGDLDSRVKYRDGFTELVKKIDRNQIGKIILVEPNPINIPYLCKCWADYPQRAEVHHVGICTSDNKNTSIRFYYTEEDAPNFQTFSMDPKHVLDHFPNTKLEHIDIYCTTLSDLITRAIGDEEIELLSLDVEGIDDDILLDTDWNKINCKAVSFEHLHMSDETMKKVRNHLNSAGLFYDGEGVDVHGYDSIFRRQENIMNPVIVSIFMSNIDAKTPTLQKQVVDKFNKSKIPHLQVLTDASPGLTMDKLMELLEKNGFDTFMFLDIDAVPVSENALDFFFEKAYNGWVIGDAQRSNHIENRQHVFAAPHNLTFSLDTYKKAGSPSFLPNDRGDVAEELTFAARERNIPVHIVMPLRFDAQPIKFHWELDQRPYWALADGMPHYGIGTTFGDTENGDMFWHLYQSFHPGQQERFWKKCEELLNG